VVVDSLSVFASNTNNADYVNQSGDFYSRFKCYVNGAEVALAGSISGNGWGESIDSERLYFGKGASGMIVDEWALYSGDQSAIAADFYNSANGDDLNELSVQPSHWWRMGDGDTFPNISDKIGSAHLTMVNMTIADIVNDVPTDGSTPSGASGGSSPISSFDVAADGTASSITITHSQGRLMTQAQLIETDGTVSTLLLTNVDENTSIVSSSTPILGTITLT
jgi:hypothetical protein